MQRTNLRGLSLFIVHCSLFSHPVRKTTLPNATDISELIFQKSENILRMIMQFVRLLLNMQTTGKYKKILLT